MVRAWDLERPLLFAPAMNTYMWQHPLSAQHVATMKTFGYHEISCVSKKLACGDTGLITHMHVQLYACVHVCIIHVMAYDTDNK